MRGAIDSYHEYVRRGTIYSRHHICECASVQRRDKSERDGDSNIERIEMGFQDDVVITLLPSAIHPASVIEGRLPSGRSIYTPPAAVATLCGVEVEVVTSWGREVEEE